MGVVSPVQNVTCPFPRPTHRQHESKTRCALSSHNLHAKLRGRSLFSTHALRKVPLNAALALTEQELSQGRTN